VGLLPVPHPIVIRKYQANEYTSLWFTAFLWGVIFLRNQRTYRMHHWSGALCGHLVLTCVRLLL
jgi:hypothetical protein